MKFCLIFLFTICLFAFSAFTKSVWAAIPRGEPGSSETPCYDLWWKDDTHPNCTQKKFCGAYLYEGLQTYEKKNDCVTALGKMPQDFFVSPQPQPWYVNLIEKIRSFFARFFLPKEQPVYDCGGFMGTQCPSGYKCKIIGGDTGTCVKSGLFGF